MDSQIDFHQAKALLEWQLEMGADEAICEKPQNRFEMPDVAPKVRTPAAAIKPVPARAPPPDPNLPMLAARAAADGANSLADLNAAMAAFDHCELKRGAKTTVFADGNPAARVMVIGEAPGRDEDIQGKPFVGRAGQLLDKMFSAIGLSRADLDAQSALYMANILPWRPPQNRDPLPAEISMMLPFVKRHVALAQPDILVLMGNISCQALLGKKGITRLRGHWTDAVDLPVLPMFHPAFLLRNPIAKRDAWHDLLMIKARLDKDRSE